MDLPEGKEIWTLLRRSPGEREAALQFLLRQAEAELRAGGDQGRFMYRFIMDKYIGKDDPGLLDEAADRFYALLPKEDQDKILGEMLTSAIEEEAERRRSKPWYRRIFR